MNHVIGHHIDHYFRHLNHILMRVFDHIRTAASGRRKNSNGRTGTKNIKEAEWTQVGYSIFIDRTYKATGLAQLHVTNRLAEQE